MDDAGGEWQTRKKTRDRYGVSARTVTRWEQNPDLGFPQSTIINHRRYDKVERLDKWDKLMAAHGRAKATHD